MDARPVDQALLQELECRPAGSRQYDQPKPRRSGQLSRQKSHGRVATRQDERARRIDRRVIVKGPVVKCAVVGEQAQWGDLDRIKVLSAGDLRSPVPARARGAHAQAQSASSLLRGSRKSDSTVQPKAADSASAAAVEGTSRPISIALTPARERPDRRASSSCDQPRLTRNARTSLSSLTSFAMIVPFLTGLYRGAARSTIAPAAGSVATFEQGTDEVLLRVIVGLRRCAWRIAEPGRSSRDHERRHESARHTSRLARPGDLVCFDRSGGPFSYGDTEMRGQDG